MFNYLAAQVNVNWWFVRELHVEECGHNGEREVYLSLKTRRRRIFLNEGDWRVWFFYNPSGLRIADSIIGAQILAPIDNATT